MNKNELEQVDGISRYHEAMWIEREDGNIKQVYDWKYNKIETKKLYLSFISVIDKDGFIYKGEFISLNNVNEIAKKRALGHQRHTKEHDVRLNL